MDDTAFRDLISGRRRGLTAALQRCGLACLSPFYSLAVRLRNRAFDLGMMRTHTAAVPVISVGNITTGGTGKTPIVAYLANWFRDREVQVAILSRGYRSLDTKTIRAASARGGEEASTSQSLGGLTPHRSPANDEKLVLDKLCPGAPHLQNPDRVAAAKSAVEQHNAGLLILDDGFQHRRLARDLDIVLIDALNPFGYGRMLPRGLLREPLSALKRADAIILTRADQCAPAEKARIIETVRQQAPNCPFAEAVFRIDGLIQASDNARPTDLQSLHGQPIVAFCGIGNPDAFRRSLADCDLRDFRNFPDHHHYTAADLDQVGRSADQHRAAAVVTTLKDLVKIDRDELAGRPLWALGLSTHITAGTEVLASLLSRFLPTA